MFCVFLLLLTFNVSFLLRKANHMVSLVKLALSFSHMCLHCFSRPPFQAEHNQTIMQIDKKIIIETTPLRHRKPP